jgi:hypothetical protein
MWLSMASAKMLRAELWVHRNKTWMLGLSDIFISKELTDFVNGMGLDLAALALTAVFRQISQHCIHAIEMRSVNQVAPAALLADQVGMHQAFEVKRQSIGRHIHVGRQFTGCEPCGAGLHQSAKYLQPRGLGQGCEGKYNRF